MNNTDHFSSATLREAGPKYGSIKSFRLQLEQLAQTSGILTILAAAPATSCGLVDEIEDRLSVGEEDTGESEDEVGDGDGDMMGAGDSETGDGDGDGDTVGDGDGDGDGDGEPGDGDGEPTMGDGDGDMMGDGDGEVLMIELDPECGGEGEDPCYAIGEDGGEHGTYLALGADDVRVTGYIIGGLNPSDFGKQGIQITSNIFDGSGGEIEFTNDMPGTTGLLIVEGWKGETPQPIDPEVLGLEDIDPENFDPKNILDPNNQNLNYDVISEFIYFN